MAVIFSHCNFLYSFRPHRVQNCRPGLSGAPHCTQNLRPAGACRGGSAAAGTDSGAWQIKQRVCAPTLVAPHFGQVVRGLSGVMALSFPFELNLSA